VALLLDEELECSTRGESPGIRQRTCGRHIIVAEPRRLQSLGALAATVTDGAQP
jgi:hypothetical protein